MGKHGDEEVIGNYVKNHGREMKDYQTIHKDNQLKLFE